MVDIQTIVDSYKTKEIKKLLAELEKYRSTDDIFEIMDDKALLNKSEGGACEIDDEGIEKIYLDPNRANEYLLGHEIMHCILHNSGWPQIRSITHNQVFKNIADALDNSFDHYIFYEKLQNIVDISKNRDKFISDLYKWPKETKKFDFVANALLLLDAFSWGDVYKNQIIKDFQDNYPRTLTLAVKLDEIRKSYNKDKIGIRNSMLESIILINNFINNQTKNKAELTKFIAVTALFTDKQLSEVASLTIKVSLNSLLFGRRKAYVTSIILKSDNSLIGGRIDSFKNRTKEIINDVNNHKSLKKILSSINIQYGIDDGINNMNSII